MLEINLKLNCEKLKVCSKVFVFLDFKIGLLIIKRLFKISILC